MPRFLTAILFALCLCSCSRVEQARQVLHEADSLRAEGRLYPDSAVMAQTVHSLRFSCRTHPDEYAKANYYYGRILRVHDNPVTAMRCFINATHSNTDDHSLLGRVYSNMGSMCYDLEDYPFAHKIFTLAYSRFLKTNDTIAQMNAIGNMALAMASQGKVDSTLMYTRQIDNQCGDSSVLCLSNHINAVAYLRNKQYSKALLYSNKAIDYKTKIYLCSCLMVKAQAYSFLNVKDSAIKYATEVYQKTNNSKEKYNALYILSHDNSHLSKDSVLVLTSDREDVHNHEIEPYKVKLAKALQLLQQDMNRKPDYGRIIVIVIVVLGLSVGGFVLWRVKKKRKAVNKDLQVLHEEAQQFKQNRDDYRTTLLNQLEFSCEALRKSADIKETLHWSDYNDMCETVDERLMLFVTKLTKGRFLTEKEVRVCVLVLIDGFKGRDMAEMLCYAETGIRNLKSKTARKIGTDGKNLREYLIGIAISENIKKQ